MLFIEDKIKVFISSKCGVENYDLIRCSIKQLLEATGIIKTYIFEESAAASNCTQDTYLNKLEECHVVLFLIDNESAITEGVMKEWKYSREIQKKAIYLFCNNPTKPSTSIENELKGPQGAKYRIIPNFKDFIREGYQSVIIDILNIYTIYSRNGLTLTHQLSVEEHQEEKMSYSISGDKQGLFFGKQKNHDFPLTYSYFDNMEGEGTEYLGQTNQLDQFAYQFIKVIHGEGKYDPSNLTLPEEDFQKMHSEELTRAVLIRWRAVRRVYEGKVDDAVQMLEEAYLFACDNKLPYWFTDDILIDKRNLEMKTKGHSYDYSEGGAQSELQKRSHVLHYPLLDRTEGNTYRAILKELYELNTQSPYTKRFGTGLRSVIDQIRRSYIISVCYGSLTHMLGINELLYKTFYYFSREYDEYQWKFLCFKFCILNNDIKSLEKVYRRSNDIIATCSFGRIKELYKLADTIPHTPERHLLKIKLIELLGYYFSDEDYNNIHSELFKIIDEWLADVTPNINLSSAVSSCIKANMSRVDHESVVARALIILNNKQYRFFDDFFSTLIEIDWVKVNPETHVMVVEQLTNIIKDPNLRGRYRSLPNLVVTMRLKCNQLKQWDTFISNNWSTFFKTHYKLEISERTPQNDEAFLFSCIEEIRERNQHQGRGGSYSSYASHPFKTMRNILLGSNVIIDADKLLDELILVSTQVLINPKQTTEEKIEATQFILFLRGICNKQEISDLKWSAFSREITNEYLNVCSSFEDGFFNRMTEFTLRTNLLFLREMLGKDISIELFEIIAMHYNASPYDNIQLLTSIEIYMEYCDLSNIRNNPYFSAVLQLVLSHVRNNNLELKVLATKCLVRMMKSEYSDIVSKSLSYIVNDADYRLKILVIRGGKESQNQGYRMVLEKLITDNHYLVRQFARDVLREGQKS
ncbi:hypothetical protein [Gorillibacterium timonense]|uniref:hypothetical protein n=1 Tax=Gorillibacterium timonense TaxID=1689269 RepID=UPI00071C5811|nr:hypothetical protein [Gorillibacterium timonense]